MLTEKANLRKEVSMMIKLRTMKTVYNETVVTSEGFAK